MANVTVLDKAIENAVMEPEDLTAQTMYELVINANTLGTTSRLRINFELSRVVGTPLPESDVGCNPCHENAPITAGLTMSEIATFTPPNGVRTQTAATSGINSIAYMTASEGSVLYYQSFFKWDFAADPLPVIDDNPNHYVFKCVDGEYTQITKVLTTTDDDFFTPLYAVGISDRPVYVLFPATTFHANAEHGTYLYYLDTYIQVFIPTHRMQVFSILDDIFYGLTDPDDTIIAKANAETGTIIATYSTILDAGFSNIKAIHAKGEWVYILANDTVIKCTQSLEIVATYALGLSSCRAMWVVDDSLIYIMHGLVGISHLQPGTGTVTTIDASIDKTTVYEVNDSTTFPIYFRLQFQKIGTNSGYFYLVSDHDNRVMKIGPVPCP
jgi:hypothetical protein